MFAKVSFTRVFALTLCVLSTMAVADDSAASDVVVLDVANFDQTTAAAPGDWLIEFYAPWCGHCKKLAPTWEQVGTQLKGRVNVAKVDVTENRALGARFGIKGFPTLLHFHDGSFHRYAGKRTVEDLVSFATGGYSKVAGTPVPPAEAPAAQEL